MSRLILPANAAARDVAATTRHPSVLSREAAAIATIAYRDVLKFFRDPARLVSTFIFPLLFIVALGGSLQANLGASLGFSLITYTFTGVYAMTLFQSATLGIISLIEDRTNDFSQEMFVAPVSRYAIIFGKILGESLVALTQGVAIVAFGLVAGVPLTAGSVIWLLPAGIAACLLGAGFGLILISFFQTERSANQVFPFLILPQFFLAGVFSPIRRMPWYLDILSKLSPMRYAVDLTRNAFYVGRPEYHLVVLQSPLLNLAIISAMFVVFLVLGTALFVRSERNR
jgi:ABC-2 type transport system permease protein